MTRDDTPSSRAGGDAAVRYWRGNLDPENLERAGGRGGGPALEAEIRFADTPDVRAALAWIAPEPGATVRITDLGCGLGAHAIHFARSGHRVIAADSSLERLRALRERARAAGVSDRITPVVARAESLPFASGSLPALFTRSVLIHTDTARAADEIGRALAPGGRAALVEPQPGNPFARLYRRTLAPKAWREITLYFTPGIQRETLRRIGGGRVEPHYLFSFLAFGFQFAFPHPALFRFALGVLVPADRLLFALIPPLRRTAWFGVILAERPDRPGQES